MLIHWIWLAHCPGLTDLEKAALLRHFGDPEDIFYSSMEELCAAVNLHPEAVQALQEKDLTASEKILEQCSREKIRILTIQDAAYPERLKNIPDPPPVLYCKGVLPDLDAVPVIGVVGTRKASAYGLQTAKHMGYQIGSCGAIVVSGLAKGVDTMAMIGGLTAGCPVVGVLGCGIDIVYPKSNKSLFTDVERYGCILSEFAPGTPPHRWNFPRRNRIIAGLSCGVLVVEAPEVSGALITARRAADQGRDVFVIPGNIDNPNCVGSNQLLRDGAIPVSSGWDVVSEYELLYPDRIHKPDLKKISEIRDSDMTAREEKPPLLVAQNRNIPAKEENLKKENDKKVIDKERSAPYSDVNDILPKLSEEERRIVTVLQSGQQLVDDVIAQTGLTTGKVLAVLTMLELKKVIVRHPGKRIGLKTETEKK